MNIFKKVKNIKDDYITYPMTFEKYRWYKPILVFILSVIFLYIFINVATGVILALVPGLSPDAFVSSISQTQGFDSFVGILGFSLLALAIPSVYLATKIVRDRPFSSYLSSVGGWNWGLFAKSAAIFFAAYIIIHVVQALIFGVQFDVKLTALSFLALIIITPLQCFAEELFCRGLLMQTFGSWFKIPIIAIVLQAIVFTFAHGYNSVGLMEILFFGLCYGFLAWYTKGLEVSSALHMANNVTLLIVSGVTTVGLSTKISLVSGLLGMAVPLLIIAALFLIDWKFNWIGLKRRTNCEDEIPTTGKKPGFSKKTRC